MKTTGNTILITGGGSGIGRGLAEAFHALGNQVIIAGRRQRSLDEVTAACPGMVSVPLDVEDPAAIRSFAMEITAKHPALNVLINNAGISRVEDLKNPEAGSTDAEATITTNLLGPIRLTTALLPHLQAQPQAAIMNVTSGLAFVPLPVTPTYCATKAALHSYTQSLRVQLQGTSVEVLDLIPPGVQTELTPKSSKVAAYNMPLDNYIAEVMSILQTQPEATEICVENVKFLRFAEATGSYQQAFGMMSGIQIADFVGA